MSEPLVVTAHLSKLYNRGSSSVKALVDATCTISPGARIAIVGPSGSGKSTLLHLLAGLDTPTGGEISWPALGLRETLLPGKIGYVFQSPSLLAPLTVLENVELPLLLTDTPPEEARRAALEILLRMDLINLSDKLPDELSGGQCQRIAVARALITRPALILADEPTGQLDHPTAWHFFNILLDMIEGSATALVISTHDQVVARRMQEIWSMKHGILEV